MTDSKELLLLKGEIATRQHIKDVNDMLLDAAQRLMHRASQHDKTKLWPQEHVKFSLAAARFKEPGNEYGSEGYEKTKEWLGSALDHHYANNSHHPQHFDHGVMGMSLFDLIEMLIDWTAASAQRSEDGILDLKTNKEQHNVPDDIMTILVNTAKEIGVTYK